MNIRGTFVLFVLVAAMAGFSGCAYYPQYPPLGLGATPAQVQAVLGPPNTIVAHSYTSTWKYAGGTQFVFRNGSAISYANYPPAVAASPYYARPYYGGAYYAPAPVVVGVGAPYYGYGGGYGPGWGGYYGRPWGGYGGGYWGGWRGGGWRGGCWR
ncbi:MAG: hypothetical protein ABI443_05230 [Chthoniobacterales bacterium]